MNLNKTCRDSNCATCPLNQLSVSMLCIIANYYRDLPFNELIERLEGLINEVKELQED